MDAILNFIDKYLSGFTIPSLTIIDIVEMVIIAFAVYEIIIWVKSTRAWILVKGLFFLLVFSAIAVVLKMDVILWIFRNVISVGIIAIVIVFQPELRSALEQIGRRNVFANVFSTDDEKGDSLLSNAAINSIIKAVYEMGRNKTGALIVIENKETLADFERSGIMINGDITSQLLINIFEHNTPLHDGAVIVRDNKITAATCYLPLSDNMELSKELGTRHRAAIGVSEETDSYTIVVSEETGVVSLAVRGRLIRDINAEVLRQRLEHMSGINGNNKKHLFRSRKGRAKQDEKETDS
ncbi:MAG: TIGR00159 family protein [Lachnospiraceae bacterium]|nr:TIGR00159 family protein [Lachnospiraceae bacterium]